MPSSAVISRRARSIFPASACDPPATAAYAAARLAIGDIEEMRGFGAIRRIIAGVGAGGSFAEVFRDEARVEVAEFEDRWRRGLR